MAWAGAACPRITGRACPDGFNWTPRAIKGLVVTVNVDVPTNKIETASGTPVEVTVEANRVILTLDLDIADALILRR